MTFKKNFIRFISDRKQSGKNALQTRAPKLEALEDRQLLDAIGFTSVEQTTFQATLSDQQSNESRYVILEVRAADGVQLSKDFTVSIRDASADEGEGGVQYISSQIENNTASFLAKYIISNDKTYVFEVGPELEDRAYEVRFVMAGDLNADNELSADEYYQLKGLAYVGQGTNAAFLERFKILYGVELPRKLDPLYDMNGNGRFDMETFRNVIEPNFADTITLNPTIQTNPTISSLKVGGETPTQVDGAENTFTSNKTSSVSGKTDATTGNFIYTTDDGTYSTDDFDLTQSSGSIALTNEDGTAGDTLTFNYTNQNGAFTITPTSGQLPEGALEMNLDNNFGTSRYTIVIDQTAPNIQASKAYIGDSPNDDDEYYTNQADFDLNVNYTLESDAETLADVLAAEPYGIYIRVSEGGEEIANKRLTQASGAYVPMTDVTEGAHTYTVKITDLAGNVYGSGTVTAVVNVDFTSPTLTIDGYEVPTGKEFMTVTSQTVTLTPQTETGATVRYTGDLEYTESQGVYTFTLAEGLNTISFTATDQAGNKTSATCKVYYEAKLEPSQGSNVTKYASTKSGVLNLYDYFNYKSGLTFTVTCSLVNLESLTEDPQHPGIYDYQFKESAESGAVESIVVVAKTASGEQSSTIHINLCLSMALWTDVTVRNELPDQDLHIVKTNGITLDGKLVNPASPGVVDIFFADEETPIIANADLAQVYAQPGHTKVYDDWRLTFTEATSGGETGFTLTLNQVDEDGETVPLEDGKYTIHAALPNGENAEEFVVYRYADPAPTCLKVSVLSENDPTPEFGITRIAAPTELDRLEGVLVSVYSAPGTLLATTTVTFDEDGNINDGYTWDYKVSALDEGIYTFTYEFTNVSQEVETVTEATPYIVDKTAPSIRVKRDGITLQNGGFAETATDMLSLDVTVTDVSATTRVCKMYNVQDETDEGTTFDPANFVLAYPNTRVEISVVDEMGNTSAWTYEFLCKPVVSDLVEDGEYHLVQTEGASEKTLDLRELFVFESETKDLSFAVEGPDEGWELNDDDTISIQWDELTSDMTLTVSASVENEPLTEVTISVIASKSQDADYPRWINLATDGTILDGTFFLNLTTGKTISGNLYDSSGIDTASLAIYQIDDTQKTLITTVENLQEQMSIDNLYELDLTSLTDGEGQPLDLEDGEYEIHFYGKDANANPKESTEENGHYQTIPFVVNRVPSVVWSLEIASTNGVNSDYVNALNLTLDGEGEISALDDEYGLNVTVTATNGTKTLNLWNGFYQNGAWVSGPGLRTDTTFNVNPQTYGMADGQWIFTVKTTNAAQAEATTQVSTVLDTIPPVITSSLYGLDYDSIAKQEATGSSADSMSWAAPDWDMTPAVNMELNVPAADVTRTYSKVLTENGEFPLDYGLNTLEVYDEDLAGNHDSATYKVVYNSAPSLTTIGEIARDSGIYVAWSESGAELDLTSFITDEEEAESPADYSAQISGTGQFSIRSCVDGILTLDAEEIPSKTTPILTGALIASATDEYGAELTQEFTVNLVSQYAENSLLNIQFNGSYPITTESGGTLTGDLILLEESSMLLTVTDEVGNSSQLDLTKGSGTFNFNTEECSFTCVQVTDIQYALTIDFAEDSLNYGTFSLLLDGKIIGEFVRRHTGEQPGVPVVSQDSIELPLGENHFEMERLDATTWALVFDDGQTIQVTGENVYADTELWVIDLLPDEEGQYTLTFPTSKLELVFMNSDGQTSSTWATIDLVYTDTVIDESLDVSGDAATVRAKLLGTYYDDDDVLTYEFTNLELASIESFSIPENHAISQISLNSNKHMVATYRPYNVEQDRSPIAVTAKTTDGKTIQFNVRMQYDKPFTLIASVTKPYEATTTSSIPPKSLVNVDSPVDYSQREYDVNDEDDEYQLTTYRDFNMQIWLKVDLPIVSRELYDQYGIPYTNNAWGLNTTVKVEGGAVKTIDSRSMFDQTVMPDEETGATFVLAKVAAANLSSLKALCACGTDGNYSCILELVVNPDVEGVSPVFTVSFDKTVSPLELFQYKTSADNSLYSDVHPAQINDGLTDQTFQLKYKESESEPEAQPAPLAAPLAAPALQVETLYAMPQSTVAEMALFEGVDSLNPAVQNSAPISAPAENASQTLAVESWIRNGNESLGCTTLLSSGIVDKDTLIDSLASSPAIQQTANAVVDSIFEEEDA